ncbi:MAG: TRAP transporter small permease [Clostridiales bacterium]|nr:TRAP transporter small permease [Clostridiales bacterium]
MKLRKIMFTIIQALCVVCFLALTVSLLLMILSRNVPFINFDVMWTDEVGRYLLVYLVFLGSGLAMMEGKHIRVTFVLDKMPPGIRHVVEVFNDLMTIVFCLVMTGGGYILVKSTGTQAVATLRKYFNMPMAWWNSAIMVGGLIMLVAVCLDVIRRVQRKGNNSETDAGQERRE